MINSRLQFSWIPQSATHKICTKFSHLRTQFAFTKNSWASQLYWKLRCSSHPMRNKNWRKNIRKAKSREPIFTLPTHTTCFSLKHSFTRSQGCRAPHCFPPHRTISYCREEHLSRPQPLALCFVCLGPGAHSPCGCLTSWSMRNHPQRELPSNLLTDLIRLQPGDEEGKAQACSRGRQPMGYDTRPYPTLHGTKPNAEMLHVNVSTPVTSVQKRTHSFSSLNLAILKNRSEPAALCPKQFSDFNIKWMR